MQIETAILTISTRGSRGERASDESGDAIKELLGPIGGVVIDYQIIPDDLAMITNQLRRMATELKAHLIVTTGGTGISPTDVTPEATLALIEKRLPGFEENMRAAGFQKTPFAILSRGVVGTYKSSLIINLPGNPKGVRENFSAIAEVIPHAIKVLQGGRLRDSAHDFTTSPS